MYISVLYYILQGSEKVFKCSGFNDAYKTKQYPNKFWGTPEDKSDILRSAEKMKLF